MKKTVAIVLIILSGFAVTPGFCADGVTVGFYQESMHSKNSADVLLMKNYIRGLLDGINWSNTLLLYEKQKPIFCPPENLGVNTSNAIQILDSEIKSRRSKKSDLISLLLLYGLERTFPCEK